MTNQNNKLDEILDSLYCDAWFAGRVAEREQSGIRSVTPKFDEAKQAIQALYAPKPVENGELREQLLREIAFYGDMCAQHQSTLHFGKFTVDQRNAAIRKSIYSQGLPELIQAHTNAAIAKVLDSLEAEFDRHAKSIGLWGMDGLVLDTLARTGNLSSEQKVERDAMVTERRALAILYGAIQAERNKLKEVK